MTDRDELLRLADMCEVATGEDRELDIAVFRAIGAPVPFQFASAMVALTYDDAERCYFAPVDGMRVRYTPPAYTGNFDDARALVPHSLVWNAGNDIHCWAHIWLDIRTYNGVPHEGRAATPALALTAAALRAMAAA